MQDAKDNAKKLFTKHQRVLGEQLCAFLDTLHPLLRNDVIRSFAGAGKLLAHDGPVSGDAPAGMWALLPCLVAQHLAPEYNVQVAYTIGLAIECFLCALDLLDDVEDEDRTAIIKEIGTARALNVSTTLLALTNTMLLSLVEIHVPFERVTALLKAVQTALLTASAGQHRDILAEQRPAESFTAEECIEIAEGKAGALMGLACSIGALGVNASNDVCSQYAELGRLLGIAQQLDNDSHDLYHILQYQQTGEIAGAKKTDLLRHKKTLPIVLAAHAMATLQVSPSTTDKEKQSIAALQESILATWGISLLYRERAHEQLRQIEAHHPVSPALRLLLGFA